MRRWWIVSLAVAALVAVVGFGAWAILATQSIGSWTGGSWVILAMIVAAAVFTGGLTGVLMWLAFYSDRKGYDEPFRPGEADDKDPD
jgi:cation transporter-like permease